MLSRSAFAALGAAATLAGLAVTAGPALADTYGYTGNTQPVTVPSGAQAVKITLTGGAGGNDRATPGGHGATVTGFARVSGGEQLHIDVGGAGHDAGDRKHGAGGWGYADGGDGGDAKWRGGAGGGGATAVRLGNQLLAVAGGGGGAGGTADVDARRGASGGDAGAQPQDGGSSSRFPGAGGHAASLSIGAGGSANACGDKQGGGGGGGGGGATPGGGAAGGCGGFDAPVQAPYGGGGGGAGASIEPSQSAFSSVTTAPTRGDGSVTFTWYTSADCHDATQVIDSTTASHTIDLSTMCSGSAPIARYTLADGVGSGHVTRLDPHNGQATYVTDYSATGIAKTTVEITNAFDETKRYTITFLNAPAGTAGLISGGAALDAGDGDLERSAVAEPPTGAAGQRWTFHDNGDGTLVLANAAQGNCLTTIDLRDVTGTPFELATCESNIPTPLRATANADASAITLTDAVSGLPLELTGTDPGAQLVVGRADDTPTWSLAPASDR